MANAPKRIVVHVSHYTVMDVGTNSGIALPENQWTMIDTISNIDCDNPHGCTIGFQSMIQAVCPGQYAYISIGASVDGTFSPNAPSTPGLGNPVVVNTRNSITVAEGPHTAAVSVYIAPTGSDPECTLGDYEVDYTKYFP